MKKLKFLSDAFVNGEIQYAKGSVVDVDNSKGSADRWLRRGIAVEVIAEEKPSKKIEEPKIDEPKEELPDFLQTEEKPKKKGKK